MGNTGAPGEKGIMGPSGPVGPRGRTGAPGPPGHRGLSGNSVRQTDYLSCHISCNLLTSKYLLYLCDILPTYLMSSLLYVTNKDIGVWIGQLFQLL